MSAQEVFSAERLEKLKLITTRNLSPQDAALEKARLDYLNNTNNKILTEEQRLFKLRQGAPMPTRLQPQPMPGMVMAPQPYGMVDPVRMLQQTMAAGRGFINTASSDPFRFNGF